jgi:transposase
MIGLYRIFRRVAGIAAKQHQFYGGIDVPARSMYVCIVSHDGEVLVHRNMPVAPEPFLQTIAPSRDHLVVAVACLFTWYGLAALCAHEGIPFVLGHALYMKASHGGKATNDRIDSQKIAALLRGGRLPQASGYPAEMRATRDLFRRRIHLMRKRAELLAHVHTTNSQDHLPAMGKTIASKANRAGVAARCADPAVQKSLAVDLALIDYDDRLLTALELHSVKSAKQPDVHTFYRLRSLPGVGKILALVLLYDIHDIRRFPRVQDFVSSCRLVKCAKEAAGKRYGTSGKKIGNASLTRAFSEAAALCLRNHPEAQQSLARLEKKHGTGKAFTIVAHQLARAVYSMLTRERVCDMHTCLHGETAERVSLPPHWTRRGSACMERAVAPLGLRL